MRRPVRGWCDPKTPEKWFYVLDYRARVPPGSRDARETGGPVQVATRERPKLRFDEHGVPTHLLNGVCSVANCPAGPPTGCVDCKYHNWDFTLVAPLDV